MGFRRSRTESSQSRTDFGIREGEGGSVADHYIGDSLSSYQIGATGELIRELLNLDAVALVDLPPEPSLAVSDLIARDLRDFPPVREPLGDVPSIAVLDSGLTSAHPLLAAAIGEATSVPLALGDGADDNGHGTRVAGIALYGSIEGCIQARMFAPELRIYSARVLNEHCKFDDSKLITTQMQEAIRYFRNTYRCRVFNLSLGDDNLPYRGGKVSPWASVLDTLSRELNVLIVVSAGNFIYSPRGEEAPDSHLQRFPRYLLDDDAKIIEPATGAIVLSVGSLALRDGLPPGGAQRNVALRPVSSEAEPSRPSLDRARDWVMPLNQNFAKLAATTLTMGRSEGSDNWTSFQWFR